MSIIAGQSWRLERGHAEADTVRRLSGYSALTSEFPD
jgi:hypothetical protein